MVWTLNDRPFNDRAAPSTSRLHNGATGHGESVHKAQTSDNFVPLPNGDGANGGGKGEHGLSVHRRGSALLMIASFFLIARAQSATGRQYRCSQCWLGLYAVQYNNWYHTLKNYKRSPRYLIGQIAGQLIKK